MFCKSLQKCIFITIDRNEKCAISKRNAFYKKFRVQKYTKHRKWAILKDVSKSVKPTSTFRKCNWKRNWACVDVVDLDCSGRTSRIVLIIFVARLCRILRECCPRVAEEGLRILQLHCGK